MGGKRLSGLRSDAGAEAFVAGADLNGYDLSGVRRVRFGFAPKTERVNMRLPAALLWAVRAEARRGVPCQRFIRQVLGEAVEERQQTRGRLAP